MPRISGGIDGDDRRVLRDPGIEDTGGLVGNGKQGGNPSPRHVELDRIRGSGDPDRDRPQDGLAANGPDQQLQALTVAARDGDQAIWKPLDHVADPTLFDTRLGRGRRGRDGFPRRARPQGQHGQASTQDQTYHKPAQGGSGAPRIRSLAGILDDFRCRHHMATVRVKRYLRAVPG